MFRATLFVVLMIAAVSAFMPSAQRNVRSELSMKVDNIKKAFAAGLIGASVFLGGSATRAEIDYDGIKYLGGGDKVDLNNANIRAYLKIPGMYPSIASKVVTNGPFKTVADVYNIPGLSGAEKDILKKFENKWVALDVKPEYDIDKINNGLYR